MLTANVEPGLIDSFAENVSILDVISACDEIHTLTSLSGFEALIRNKPVTCYGLPFYAGWGLTIDKIACDRRARRLNLEELIAGSLILYPSYIDPVSNLPCTPEIVMKRIDQIRQNSGPMPALVRARMILGNARKLRRRFWNR